MKYLKLREGSLILTAKRHSPTERFNTVSEVGPYKSHLPAKARALRLYQHPNSNIGKRQDSMEQESRLSRHILTGLLFRIGSSCPQPFLST